MGAGQILRIWPYFYHFSDSPDLYVQSHKTISEIGRSNDNALCMDSVCYVGISNMDSCAKYMIKDVATVADAVSTYASSDPCVACAERVAITDKKGNTTTKNIFEVR